MAATRVTRTLIPTPADRDTGWTPSRLRAAHLIYKRDVRTPIVIDGQRRYARACAATRAREAIYAAPPNVDLDDAMWLLQAGEIPERVAQRLGVTWDAIQVAARRSDDPAVLDRIAHAKTITAFAAA